LHVSQQDKIDYDRSTSYLWQRKVLAKAMVCDQSTLSIRIFRKQQSLQIFVLAGTKTIILEIDAIY
jgi:hypothetical protein